MPENSEYRLVYNWAKSATDVCEVWYDDLGRPSSYAELFGVGTHDDDASLGEADEPEDRLRDRLKAMLAACDKPVLRFPEDFDDRASRAAQLLNANQRDDGSVGQEMINDVLGVLEGRW